MHLNDASLTVKMTPMKQVGLATSNIAAGGSDLDLKTLSKLIVCMSLIALQTVAMAIQ